MPRLVGAWVRCVVLVCLCCACGGNSTPAPADGGSSSGGPPPDGGSPPPPGTPDAEQVRQGVLAIITADPRLGQQKALGPDDYEALAGKFAAVNGVEGADFSGDTLGTFQVKVREGGLLFYRHITNDLTEAATLPKEADFANQLHPRWNDGWKDAVTGPDVRVRSAPTDAVQQNTYATHFPVAGAAPDPEYAADDAVTCPAEGKIAIVDFLWTEAHRDFPGLYDSQYNVDGKMLYDRLQLMGKAGGFQVDVFKDDEINAGNFTRLQDYAVVFTNGHGGRPGVLSTKRLGAALLALITPEAYDPAKMTAYGKTYEQAWKDGEILYSVDKKQVIWTPRLLRDHYKPTVPQHVMLNECWSMLPFNIGLNKGSGGWTWDQGVTAPLENFGDALMQAGVKAVFGYVSPATPEAVVQNSMPFFRRMFGGNSAKDRPPKPLNYWPTCMGTQTYFRLPNTPQLPIYGNKYRGRSMYTMYAVPENLLVRKACPGSVPHAQMQDFTLRVGTPATAYQLCWDKWWGHGQHPSGLQDPLCALGDDKTTQELTTDAACAVKIARKVTNAMLQ